MENETREDGFIKVEGMGEDCVQLIDDANNKETIILRFSHKDSPEDKAIKIDAAKSQLIADRIKANLKNPINK